MVRVLNGPNSSPYGPSSSSLIVRVRDVMVRVRVLNGPFCVRVLMVRVRVLNGPSPSRYGPSSSP